MNNNSQTCSTSEHKTVEAANRKLLGVYPQKQDGSFMQRVKIFGGRISWPQWRAVAQLAIRYTPQTPLHLTTRQDIEFHNAATNDLPAIQQGLAAAGLSTLGAGGDSLRNITVGTDCESAGGIDVYELARLIGEHLASEPNILSLPRKFKISFSGCPMACAKPFINDLGLVAQENGLFLAIGAGSLGPKPGIGINLYKNLSATDILPLCKAAIAFFNEEGDRQNRRKARLRHVRERLGDEAFKRELDKRFEKLREKNENQNVTIESKNKKLNLLTKLQLPNGDITARDALTLADYAEPLNLELRINLTHGLELYASAAHGHASLLAMPPTLAALTNLPTIVACPGCKTCPNALTDCCATAENLREILKDTTSQKSIHISGCPNDCAQAVVADIGLVGIVRTIEGVRTQCYRVLTGGAGGSTAALAKETAVIPVDSVAQYVKAIIAGECIE
jgi:sulfite reductase (ferredoxin)